jgi:hypothetical protein
MQLDTGDNFNIQPSNIALNESTTPTWYYCVHNNI